MKKHFKSYVCDFPGAKELRDKTDGRQKTKEVEKILRVITAHRLL